MPRKPGVNAEDRIKSELMKSQRFPLSQAQICRATKLSPGAVSRGLRRLEKKGNSAPEPASDAKRELQIVWSLTRRAFPSIEEAVKEQPKEAISSSRIQSGLCAEIMHVVNMRDMEIAPLFHVSPSSTIAKSERLLIDQLTEQFENQLKSNSTILLRDGLVREAILTVLKRGAFRTQPVVMLVPSKKFGDVMTRLRAEVTAEEQRTKEEKDRAYLLVS